MAIIVTDEEGVIESCNTKAQCLFHCSMSCSQSKKLHNLCTLIYNTNTYVTPTLWEIAHISHRPLSLLNLNISTVSGEHYQMDLCTLWLNKLHEEHFRIAFFFLPALNLPQPNPDGDGDRIEDGVILHRYHLILGTSTAFDTMSGYKEEDIIGQDTSLLMTDSSADTLRHMVKLHDTTVWSGLIIQDNKFLLPVEVRSFPLLNLYPDAIITLLHRTDI